MDEAVGKQGGSYNLTWCCVISQVPDCNSYGELKLATIDGHACEVFDLEL